MSGLKPSVHVIATLDTKGHEADVARQFLLRHGVAVTMVDASCAGEPQVAWDVSREEVFAASGTPWSAVQSIDDRGQRVRLAAAGVTQIIQQAHAEGRLLGVLALGGSAGTTIGTAAMRALPLGVPKIMISTLASGDVRAFVGTRDIAMVHSVVDLAGVNRISRLVLEQSAAMMCGCVQCERLPETGSRAAVIGATMFGVTTPCVQHARQRLEQLGYEVLVFHATGSGGQTLEGLIDEGWIAGVLDITTTELADHLFGGVLSAGPNRLTASARRGVPQVVSVGATDMVNFWAPETIPGHLADRLFHRHNDHVTLMRTTVEENWALGRHLAEALRGSGRTTRILLPSHGVSALDRAGQPFDNPAARHSLFEAIQAHSGDVPVELAPYHVNDPAFADLAVDRLLELMNES